MKPYTLGIDTSCYTTSLAVVGPSGELIAEKRKMLSVKKGARGLRQSEGFFQHVMNLPELFEALANEADLSQVGCVAVSTRPRNVAESYMPVFAAGEKFARTLATAWSVPVFTTTHQDGHLMASALGSGFDHVKEHISLHLSGGTSEILHSRWKNGTFEVEIAGGTLDVSAGQLLDRIGVAMGLDFPCGRALDDMAFESDNQLKFPVSVKDTWFNLSGAETYGLKYAEASEADHEIAAGLFGCLVKTLEKSLKAACERAGVNEVLMAGGVASSRTLKRDLTSAMHRHGIHIHFSASRYSADNAIGVAALGAENRRDLHEA